MLVAVGMVGLQSVSWGFLLYVFGGCALGPWLLVGATPLRRGPGYPFRPSGRAEPGWVHLVSWLFFGAVLVLLYLVLRQWLVDADEVARTLRALRFDPESRNLYFAFFVLFVPLFEEWWWRGQALPRCRELFGPRVGFWMATVGFTSYHGVVLWQVYDPLSVALRLFGIGVGGALFGWMTLRTEGWRWAYSSHLAADVAIVVAFVLLVGNAG